MRLVVSRALPANKGAVSSERVGAWETIVPCRAAHPGHILGLMSPDSVASTAMGGCEEGAGHKRPQAPLPGLLP